MRRLEEEILVSAKDRIGSVVVFLESLIWGTIRRPRMYGASLAEAERSVLQSLHIRDKLLGRLSPSWRRWLADRYPTVPGSVRSVASGVEQMHPPEHHHDNFVAEMTLALSDLYELTPSEM